MELTSTPHEHDEPNQENDQGTQGEDRAKGGAPPPQGQHTKAVPTCALKPNCIVIQEREKQAIKVVEHMQRRVGMLKRRLILTSLCVINNTIRRNTAVTVHRTTVNSRTNHLGVVAGTVVVAGT